MSVPYVTVVSRPFLYGPVAVSIDTGDVVMPLKLLVEPVVLYPQVLTVSAAGEPLPLAGMVLPSLFRPVIVVAFMYKS